MDSFNTPSRNKKLHQHQDRNNFLQQLADLTPDLLFVIDLDNQELLYVNNKVEHFLGQDADNLYDQGREIMKKFIHPDDYQKRMENLELCKQLTDNKESEVEVRLKSSDGGWNWFRIKDKIFKRDENGTVTQTIGIAQNIQEQKIADEKLKKEHRRLKDAQALGHIGSFEWPLPGELVICSEEFYNIHGIKPRPEGISIQEFISFVHPDDRKAFLEAIHKMHATGEPLDEINRIIRQDGSTRCVHQRFEVIQNNQEKHIRIYGTIQDITKQVEAQEKIMQSEALMRQAEAVGNFGSYELDLTTMNFQVSDGFYRLFGYEPQGFELSLEFIDGVSHPGDTKKVMQVLEQARQDKKPYEYLRRIYLPNGQMRYLSSKGKVICDNAGNAIKFLGIVENVTERKLAEKQLEESALFIKKVANTTPDILFVFDIEQRQLQYINRDLSQLIGKSREAFKTMDPEFLLSFIHPEELEGALAYIRSFTGASDDDLNEVEFRIRDLRGALHWYHCRGRVFKRSKEGKVVQFLSIMRDITEERNTTKALLEAEKLSVKGTMARTIAHEVRGPAANISLSIKMIQEELGDTLTQNKEAMIYLDIVSKSCNRITNFINDLINISVTEPDAFVESDLGILVEEVLTQAQDRIFLKGIQVERHFSGGYFINADQEKLKIAILNIVMNAIEAMEEQDGILQVSIREQDSAVYLSIQDNGCGMTEEQMAKMFEIYYTNKPNGMGVGLANVKAILQEHSAGIEVKSEAGKGTEFTIIFTQLK